MAFDYSMKGLPAASYRHPFDVNLDAGTGIAMQAGHEVLDVQVAFEPQ